nr:Chain Z, reaction center unknown polypeptide [Roseiflexus castenholzii]8IUN_Z Chain Z, reaction center unknown polypeptide [Roseiflexus castenholzii]
AAAPAGAAAA